MRQDFFLGGVGRIEEESTNKKEENKINHVEWKTQLGGRAFGPYPALDIISSIFKKWKERGKTSCS